MTTKKTLVSYYTSTKTPKEQINKSIQEIYNIIKNGDVKEHTDYLRQEKEKKKRQEYKKTKLPAVIFQGVFTQRNNNNIKKPSGLATLDFDDYDGNMQKVKEEIVKDEHVFMAFISPSGGLKVVVRIPEIKEDARYKILYNQIIRKFSKFKVTADKSTKDIARLCYLSYDPDVYLNTDAKEFGFEQVEENPQLHDVNTGKNEEEKSLTPKEGNRNNRCYILAMEYKERDYSQKETLELLKQFNRNFSPPLPEREIVQIVKSAYERKLNSKDALLMTFDKNGLPKKETLVPYKAVNFLRQEDIFYTVKGSKKESIHYYKDGVFIPDGERYIQEQVYKYWNRLAKNYHVNEITKNLKGQTFIDREEFEKTALEKINLKDCVIDISGATTIAQIKKERHTPEYRFMYKIPVEYNPKAKSKYLKPFIEQTLEKKQIKEFYQYLGFCLYRDYKFKKAAIFLGETDTGKTTLIHAITKMIGECNTSELSLHKISSSDFAAKHLRYKLANIHDDLSYSDLNDVAKFKIATGGGYLSAEEKFGDQFSFKNYAKLMFATNRIPKVEQEGDEAYFGRWIVFLFNNIIEKKDVNLKNKITQKEELEWLLIKSLEGLLELLANNEFSSSYTTEEVTEIMIKSSDPFKHFIEEATEDAPGEKISKELFYELFTLWCKNKSLPLYSYSKYGKELKKAPVVVSQTKWGSQEKHYCVIDIKPNEEIFRTFRGFENILYKIKNNNKTSNDTTILNYKQDFSKSSESSDLILNTIPPKGKIAFEVIEAQTGIKEKQLEDALRVLAKNGKVYEPIRGFWSYI